MDFIGLLETGKWSDGSHIIGFNSLIIKDL